MALAVPGPALCNALAGPGPATVQRPCARRRGTLGGMSSCLVTRMFVAGMLGYVLGSFTGVHALSWGLVLVGVAAVLVWSWRSGAVRSCPVPQGGAASERRDQLRKPS